MLSVKEGPTLLLTAGHLPSLSAGGVALRQRCSFLILPSPPRTTAVSPCLCLNVNPSITSHPTLHPSHHRHTTVSEDGPRLFFACFSIASWPARDRLRHNSSQQATLHDRRPHLRQPSLRRHRNLTPLAAPVAASSLRSSRPHPGNGNHIDKSPKHIPPSPWRTTCPPCGTTCRWLPVRPG